MSNGGIHAKDKWGAFKPRKWNKEQTTTHIPKNIRRVHSTFPRGRIVREVWTTRWSWGWCGCQTDQPCCAAPLPSICFENGICVDIIRKYLWSNATSGSLIHLGLWHPQAPGLGERKGLNIGDVSIFTTMAPQHQQQELATNPREHEASTWQSLYYENSLLITSKIIKCQMLLTQNLLKWMTRWWS